MAEHINNNASVLSSGGHDWVWGDVAKTKKQLATAGLTGEARQVMHVGAQQVTITGLLRAADDSALNDLEDFFMELEASGRAVSWGDQFGRNGTSLVIDRYVRNGTRTYGSGEVWQKYTVFASELAGGPAAAAL